MKKEHVIGNVAVGRILMVAVVSIATLCGMPKAWSRESRGIPLTAKESAFIKQLRVSVNDGDKSWIADHIFYPLGVVINGKRVAISGPKEFLRNYTAIVNRDVRNVITNRDPGNVSKSSKGIMLGGGEVWIMSLSRSPRGPFVLYVVAINNDM